MNPFSRRALLCGGAALALSTTACVYTEPGYGYDSGPSGYYSSGHYGAGYGGGPRYFPGVYGRGYRGGHHHHDDHNHNHDRRGSGDHGDGRVRLTDPGSRHGDRDHPEGWHSREWFERRGYDTSSDRFEDRAGHRYGRGETHREAAREDRRGDRRHRH